MYFRMFRLEIRDDLIKMSLVKSYLNTHMWGVCVCVCKLAELNFKTTFAKVRHTVALSKAHNQPSRFSWWRNSITFFFFSALGKSHRLQLLRSWQAELEIRLLL